MGDFSNISKIMKKTIIYNYSMLKNFTAISCMFLHFITASGFYTLPLCKPQ
jgi:hypothetical protein